jgi:hypothetical protein
MGASWSVRASQDIGPLVRLCGSSSTGVPDLRFKPDEAQEEGPEWQIRTSRAIGGPYGDRNFLLISANPGIFNSLIKLTEPNDYFQNNTLVLDANGHVALNREAAQPFNEFEVFGSGGSNDQFATMALTPGGSDAESSRLTVSTATEAMSIGVRSSTGGNYNSLLRGHLDAPNHSIAVDADGDVAVGGVPFEAINSAADLQIGGRGRLYLDPIGSDGDWYTNAGPGGLLLVKPTTFQFPFGIENDAPSNSLMVVDSGVVGMGTGMPDASLHILRGDETAGLKVEETNEEPKIRQLVELVNNGGVRLALENTDVGERWDFTNDKVGNFLINRVGTGGPEMTVTTLGRLISGPGRFAALDSRPNGNLFIAGTLFESSDREKKENFEEVDCQEILDKVAELPITTWNYKSDNEAIRHMGPVAQDFKAAFELGDSDKTIATTDKAGISLAAIKALNAKLRQQVERLEKRDKEMTERLERFESMLEQLTSTSR